MLSCIFPSYFLSLVLTGWGLKWAGVGEPFALLGAAVLAVPLSFIVNWLFEETFGRLMDAAIQASRKPRRIQPMGDPWNDEIKESRSRAPTPEN